jgi:hypothetical protein
MLGFVAQRATCLKADGKDIIDVKLILNGDSSAEDEGKRHASALIRDGRLLGEGQRYQYFRRLRLKTLFIWHKRRPDPCS